MVTSSALVTRRLTEEDGPCFANLATGFGQGQLSGDCARWHRTGLIAIGAWVEGEPAGLFLGRVINAAASPFMNVLTLRVAEHCRRQGVATLLLSEAEDCARTAGCGYFSALLADGSPEGPAAQALAERDGWRRVRLTRTIYKIPYPTLETTHWAVRVQLWPSHFEVFPWRDLKAEEKTELLKRQNDTRYFDTTLPPFKGNRICTGNSVGLRVSGEIMGWAISWNLSENSLDRATMCGTRLFVGSDLQRRGYGAMLLAEHFRRSPAAGINCSLFSIAPDNDFMLRFMRKHLKQYVTHFREIWEVRKPLC